MASSLLMSLFICILSLFVSWFVYKLISMIMSPIYSIPGPKSEWSLTGLIFGQLPAIIAKPPIIPQLGWAKEFGGMVCYRTTFFTHKIIVCSPTALKRVLVTNNRNYPKNDYTRRLLTPFVGNSILVAENEEHSRQRSYLSPAFHFKHQNGFQKIFAKFSKTLCDYWMTEYFNNNKTNNNLKINTMSQEIDINEAMTKMTLDIIGLTAFAFSFNSIKEKDSIMVQHYETVFSSTKMSISSALRNYFPWFAKIPTSENKRNAYALYEIKKQVKEIIEKKQKSQNNGDKDNEIGTDLLSIMLQTSIDENGNKISAKGVSATELMDNVMTFLVAGHETTATTLTWALHLLSINPETQSRLQDEVDKVLKNDIPTPELMDQLPLIGAAVDETLRLFPAAPLTTRQAIQDDVLDGYKIPAGTMVFICPGVLHRLPSLWSDPDEFIIDRWIDGRDPAIKNSYAYMPFLVGPHACIGRRFARLEACTALATLVQKFNFAPVPGRAVTPQLRVTQRPNPSLHLMVSPRN